MLRALDIKSEGPHQLLPDRSIPPKWPIVKHLLKPVFELDLSILHTQILTVIGAASIETMEWVKHHSTVNQVIRTKPSAEGGNKPLLRERCDSDFVVIKSTDNLDGLTFSHKPFYICENNGEVEAILDNADLGEYFISLIDQNGDLMVELKDHNYDSVITHRDAKHNFITLRDTESFSLIGAALKGKRIRFILTMTDENQILGVIARSHRRY
ncbi:MAG: hypothetical protein ACI8WB_004136 [Phenylobacterium sp.]